MTPCFNISLSLPSLHIDKLRRGCNEIYLVQKLQNQKIEIEIKEIYERLCLTSPYILKTGVHEPIVNIRKVLRKVLEDLEFYIDGKAPETLLACISRL